MLSIKLGWGGEEKKRKPLRQELHLHDRRSAETSSYTEEEIKPAGRGRYCAATRPLLRGASVLIRFPLIETTGGLRVIKKEFQDNPGCRRVRLIGWSGC